MTANEIYTATLTETDAWYKPRTVKVAWIPERIEGVDYNLEEQGLYIYAWNDEDDCPVYLATDRSGGVSLHRRFAQFTGHGQVIAEAGQVDTLEDLEPGTYVVLRDSDGDAGPEWSDDRDADDRAVRDAQQALTNAVLADATARATFTANAAAACIAARDRYYAELLIERGLGDDPLLSFDSGRAFWDGRQPQLVSAIAWYGEGTTDYVDISAPLTTDDAAWMQQVADELEN